MVTVGSVDSWPDLSNVPVDQDDHVVDSYRMDRLVQENVPYCEDEVVKTRVYPTEVNRVCPSKINLMFDVEKP